MDLDLEPIELTSEEEELLENDLYPIRANENTPFEEINLFMSDEDKPLRYYLEDIIWCWNLRQLLEQREHIIEDMTNLGIFSSQFTLLSLILSPTSSTPISRIADASAFGNETFSITYFKVIGAISLYL